MGTLSSELAPHAGRREPRLRRQPQALERLVMQFTRPKLSLRFSGVERMPKPVGLHRLSRRDCGRRTRGERYEYLLVIFGERQRFGATTPSRRWRRFFAANPSPPVRSFPASPGPWKL